MSRCRFVLCDYTGAVQDTSRQDAELVGDHWRGKDGALTGPMKDRALAQRLADVLNELAAAGLLDDFFDHVVEAH